MNELRMELQMPAENAAVCREALEIESKSMHRAEISMEEFPGGVRILVSTEDLSAMRAAVNTYLRWIIMCCNLME